MNKFCPFHNLIIESLERPDEEKIRKAYFNSSYSHPLFALLMAKYPYDKAVEVMKDVTGFGVKNAEVV